MISTVKLVEQLLLGYAAKEPIALNPGVENGEAGKSASAPVVVYRIGCNVIERPEP